MIDVIHVPEREALATATHIVKTLGAKHDLSLVWIKAVAKFGYRHRPDRPDAPFSRPV